MAEAEAAAVLKVFILVTEHHNGRNVYPCSSYERAWARLDQYVQEFWNSSGGHIPPDPPTPGDPKTIPQEQRIAMFYDHWQSKRVESWEIEEYEVLS
jgi:hypothetical protein